MQQLEPCKVLVQELSNRNLIQQEQQHSRSRLRYLLMKGDPSNDRANHRRKKVQRRKVKLELHKALELEQAQLVLRCIRNRQQVHRIRRLMKNEL